MKNFLYPILCTCLLFSSIRAGSQNLTRQPSCADPFILHQADSIKQEFLQRGFIVVREAAMTMESENEMPVMVPLTESIQYQFIFIGDMSSRSYEVRMFDWDEKQVAFQKSRIEDVVGNVISYAYVPAISEYHMMKPLQVNNKKKNVCGYVLLLKKIKR